MTTKTTTTRTNRIKALPIMAPLMIPERKKEMIKAEQQDFSARSLNS